MMTTPELAFNKRGTCECGCGNPTPLATRTRRERGQVKGQPLRFLLGHNSHELPPLIDRLMERVSVRKDGCWEWTGGTTSDGDYPRFCVAKGQYVLAHRWSYEHHVGPIPEGLTLDHLCRFTLCVNPTHLESVTKRRECHAWQRGVRRPCTQDPLQAWPRVHPREHLPEGEQERSPRSSVQDLHAGGIPMTQPALAHNVRGKGRHYTHPVTGETVPSITNIISILDRPAIPRWAAKMVAENAWKMRHSLVEMGQDECIDVLKGSPWRKSGRAAHRGTSVHEYLEAAAHGRTVELTGEALEFKAGADDFLERYQPEFYMTEFTVFGEGYAGTADFLARIGDQVVIGDFKTSKALYPEVALQLAAIRHASKVVDSDGNVSTLHPVDGCVGVLITRERAYVHQVDAGPEAYRAFRACLDAWCWRKAGGPIGEELPAAVEGVA